MAKVFVSADGQRAGDKYHNSKERNTMLAVDVRPTEGSLDEPRGRRSVIGTIAARGFVVDASDAPTTHRRASPLFTG